MPLRLEIDQLRIDAPGSWAGKREIFRRLLERALADELQGAVNRGNLDAHQILRVDVPPVTVSDIYDMQTTAQEIARRIAQTIRQGQR